jgi:hypothetical protein
MKEWTDKEVAEVEQDFPFLGLLARRLDAQQAAIEALQRRSVKLRRWQAGAAASLVLAALGAWFSYPWTKQQCYERAAQARTVNGTQIMYRVCMQEFGDLK